MGKSTHFIGQPLYSQVIKLLDKEKILEISRKNGGERYIKRFDSWTHLVVMLYGVIMRFDSLREISTSLQAEARKLCHLGISMRHPVAHCRMPTRDVRMLCLRLYIVICTLLIILVFHRTAGVVRNPNG